MAGDAVKRLWGPGVVGTGAEASVYTPAGGETVTVRRIQVNNHDGTDHTFRMYIGATWATSKAIYPDATTVPANGSFIDDGLVIVLTSSDTVYWNGNSNLQTHASGVVTT